MSTSASPAGALRSRGASLRGLASRRPRLVEWSLVTALYGLLAVVLTWPVTRFPTTSIYGFGNDNWGGLWNAEYLHDAFWGPEKADFTPQLQAPFGNEIDDRFIQPVDRLFFIVFGGVGDAGIFAYNLQIFVTFVLAGAFMYALVRYLTGSWPAAVLAGVIFTASPFHLAMAMQYPAMATIQFLPLLVLALVHALRTRRPRDAALAGAALALVWISSYYYGWFAIWFLLAVFAALGVRGIVRAARARRLAAEVRETAGFLVTRLAAAIGAFLLVTVPLLAPLALKVGSEPETYERAGDDLFFSAVRPWQFFLPPHDNPIFGPMTRDFIQSHLGILPVYEQSTYLGFVPVVLAIAGLVLLRRASAAARFAAWPLLVGGTVTALMTLGSYVPTQPFSVDNWMHLTPGERIKSISGYLFDVNGSFRYYGRAFVFTSCALAALAGIGFALLTRRLSRTRPVAVALLAALASGLVLAEFINRPSPGQQGVYLGVPEWVKAVRKLPPDATIAQYPYAGTNGPRSLWYIFMQGLHERATINPAVSEEASELWQATQDPDSPESARRLKRAGVDYAVIHTKLPDPTFPPYQPDIPNDALSPERGEDNPWFERVAATEDAVIYRLRDLDTRIAETSVNYSLGFSGPEIEHGQEWRWVTGADATLRVTLGGPRRTVRLRFGAQTFAVDRRVRVLVDERPVATLRLDSDRSTMVRLPLRLSAGEHDVKLLPAPGPLLINDVLNNGDKRRVSIRVSKPQLDDPRRPARRRVN